VEKPQDKSFNATMVASENSVISQLMEQVSQVKFENKQLLDRFDWLAAQMEAFMSNQTPQPTRCQVKGHRNESSNQT